MEAPKRLPSFQGTVAVEETANAMTFPSVKIYSSTNGRTYHFRDEHENNQVLTPTSSCFVVCYKGLQVSS
jgi:hypothetical protein